MAHCWLAGGSPLAQRWPFLVLAPAPRGSPLAHAWLALGSLLAHATSTPATGRAIARRGSSGSPSAATSSTARQGHAPTAAGADRSRARRRATEGHGPQAPRAMGSTRQARTPPRAIGRVERRQSSRVAPKGRPLLQRLAHVAVGGAGAGSSHAIGVGHRMRCKRVHVHNLPAHSRGVNAHDAPNKRI